METPASFQDFQKLLIQDPSIQICHWPDLCPNPGSLVEYFLADPDDLTKFDSFICTGCLKEAPVGWFIDDKYEDWIAANYASNRKMTCECGSASIGIKPFRPGHAWYCPVTVVKK